MTDIVAKEQNDELLKEKIRRQTVEYIRDLTNRIRSMEDAKKELIDQLQADCPHPVIFRAPYKEGIIIDQYPILLCGTCKLQEDEWNCECTLKHVKNAILTEVERDALWVIRATW